MPRKRVMVVAATALVLAAGTLAGIGIARSSGGPAAPEFTLVTPYPPAVAADAELAGQGAGATALPVSLTGIAAAGKAVVAIGAAPSQPGPVPLMLLSTDGGHTWTRAALAGTGAAPSGSGAGPGAASAGPGAGPGLGITAGSGAAAGPGTPTAPGAGAGTGNVPALIARGGGLWLALGQHVAWISPDGKTWRPAPVLPPVTGDTVLGLAGTSSGFVAVGEHTGGQPGPVVWTSSGRRPWQRRSGAALRLKVRSGRVTALRWAAAQNGVFLAGGPIRGAAGRGRRPDAGLWRSTDGGLTWAPVRLPAAHGVTGGLAGLAASGSGFVAVRPGHKAGHQDAVIYLSAKGSSWRYAGKLMPVRRASIKVTQVSGSGHGFVVAATVRSSQVAFFSAHGHGWHHTAYPGTGVAGLTAGTGPDVVVAGNSQRGTGPAGFRPHLLLIGSAGGRQQVGQSVLAAAATPDVTVNGLAADGRTLVAAGAAGGSPAVWLASPAGRWTPAGVLLPGSWRDGALVSVVHGGHGWLAVGQVAAQAQPAQAAAAGAAVPGTAVPRPPARYQPVILTSATGASWIPAFRRSPLAAPEASLAQAAAGPAGYVVVGSAPAAGTPAPGTSAPGTPVPGTPAPGTPAPSTPAPGTSTAGTPAAGAPVPVAWYSKNLSAWARAPLPVPGGYATDGPAASRQVLAVAAGGPGFVAVGSSGSTPVAWTSRSGSAWRFTALPLPAGAVGAVLTKVTAVGGRVVAAGDAWRGGSARVGGRPFTAVSADGGRTWRDSVPPAPPQPTVVTALAAAGHGFVAVGRSGLPGRQIMLAWWSSEGLTWQDRVPTGRGLNGLFVMQINALTAGNGTITGAGFAASTAAEHPVLWHARYR